MTAPTIKLDSRDQSETGWLAPWPLALGGGILATLAAGGVMLYLRSALQVRTVPERVMEWLLLFVPLDVFEAGLRRFGFDAKRYALLGAILGMLAILAVAGRPGPAPALVGAAPGRARRSGCGCS